MTNCGYNKVIIEGTLEHEPEIKQHPTHGVYAKLCVTTTETWVDVQSGKESTATEHYQVILVGQFANIARNQFRCGTVIYIEAQLRTRVISANGKQQFYMDVLVNPARGHTLRKLTAMVSVGTTQFL